MKLKRFCPVLLVLLLLAALPASVLATWSTDSTQNNPISLADGNQINPQAVTDGAGGAIITWVDGRSDNVDIYAQRIDASGNTLWTANGVAIRIGNSLASIIGNSPAGNLSTMRLPQLVADGAGGAIIAWEDTRSGQFDIYAQRVDASGNTLWTANGVAVTTSAGTDFIPQLVSDGSGGAIITWADYNENTGQNIYAQRVDNSGNVMWTANGVAIGTSGSQSYPQLMADGVGGAIIAWQDYRNGPDDIYAQRVNASGNVMWTANGVAVSTAAQSQGPPRLVTDGAGGAIITWGDYRSDSSWDIYTQRINPSGNTLWTANGVAVSTSTNSQINPQLVSDGAGGAIIVWRDKRNDTIGDIYAQRVNASGNVMWTTDDVAISAASGGQSDPQLATDGSDGAIIAWRDNRNGWGDIYAQRVNPSGNAMWTTNGVAISTATKEQAWPQLIADGAAGAIITWHDYRNGNGNIDIYAQRVSGAGALSDPPLPDITVSPLSKDFDAALIGTSSTVQTITISNNGMASLIIGTINKTGANAAEFSIQNDNASGQTVAPSNSVTLQVVFSPASAGNKTASLSIPSNDPDQSTVTISLSGTVFLRPVGGEIAPANRASVLAFWLGLASALTLITGSALVGWRRLRRS